MSGRRPKKTQRIGSSRRGPKGLNRNNEEKDNDDRCPQIPEGEDGQSDFPTSTENQSANTASDVQFDCLPGSSIDQQMSTLECPPRSQSHMDSVMETELPERKRKMGSTRKSIGRFKQEKKLEYELHDEMSTTEGLHEVTQENISVTTDEQSNLYEQSGSYNFPSNVSLQTEDSGLKGELGADHNILFMVPANKETDVIHQLEITSHSHNKDFCTHEIERDMPIDVGLRHSFLTSAVTKHDTDQSLQEDPKKLDQPNSLSDKETPLGSSSRQKRKMGSTRRPLGGNRAEGNKENLEGPEYLRNMNETVVKAEVRVTGSGETEFNMSEEMVQTWEDLLRKSSLTDTSSHIEPAFISSQSLLPERSEEPEGTETSNQSVVFSVLEPASPAPENSSQHGASLLNKELNLCGEKLKFDASTETFEICQNVPITALFANQSDDHAQNLDMNKGGSHFTDSNQDSCDTRFATNTSQDFRDVIRGEVEENITTPNITQQVEPSRNFPKMTLSSKQDTELVELALNEEYPSPHYSVAISNNYDLSTGVLMEGGSSELIEPVSHTYHISHTEPTATNSQQEITSASDTDSDVNDSMCTKKEICVGSTRPNRLERGKENLHTQETKEDFTDQGIEIKSEVWQTRTGTMEVVENSNKRNVSESSLCSANHSLLNVSSKTVHVNDNNLNLSHQLPEDSLLSCDSMAQIVVCSQSNESTINKEESVNFAEKGNGSPVEEGQKINVEMKQEKNLSDVSASFREEVQVIGDTVTIGSDVTMESEWEHVNALEREYISTADVQTTLMLHDCNDDAKERQFVIDFEHFAEPGVGHQTLATHENNSTSAETVPEKDNHFEMIEQDTVVDHSMIQAKMDITDSEEWREDVAEHLTNVKNQDNGSESDGQTENLEQNRVSTDEHNNTSHDRNLETLTVYDNVENISVLTDSGLLIGEVVQGKFTIRTSKTEDGSKQKRKINKQNDAVIQSSCISDVLSEKSNAVSICNIMETQSLTKVFAESAENESNIERLPEGGATEPNSEIKTQNNMFQSTISEGEKTEENIHDVSALVGKEEVIGEIGTLETNITTELDFLTNEASPDASQNTFKLSENAEKVSTVTDSGLLVEEVVKLGTEETNTVPEESKIISINPEDSHRDEKDSKLNLIVHKRKMGSTRRPLRGKNSKGKTEKESKEMDGDNEGVEAEPHSDIQDQDNVIDHNITQEMMDVKYEEDDEKTTKTVRMSVQEPGEDSAANEDSVEQEQISSSNVCQAQSASVQDDANLHLSEDQEKTADFTSDKPACVTHSDLFLSDVQHMEETQSHVSAEHAVVVDRSLQKRKMGSTRKTRRRKNMENEREVGEEKEGEIENTTIDDGATKTEEIFTHEKVSTTVIESHLHKELFNSSLDNEGHDCIQAGKDVNEGSEQKETLFRIKSEHDVFDRGDETSEESKETPDFKETVGHEEVDAEPVMILDVPEHLNDVNDHENEHAENVSSVTESALLNADVLTVGSGETDTIPKEHEIITVIPENSQEDVQSKSHSEIQTLKKMLQNKVSTEEQNDTSSDMNLAAVTVHENEQTVSTVTDSGLHTEDVVTVESGETNTIPEQNETIPENSQEDVHSKSNLIVHKQKMGSTRRTHRGNKGQRKRGEHHDENETIDSEINEEKEIFSVEDEHNLDEYTTRTSETEDGAKEQKTEVSESNDAAPVEGSDSVLIQSSCTSDLLSEKSTAVSICNITESQMLTEIPAESTEIDGNIEKAPVGGETKPNSEIQTQKKMLHSTTSEGERTEENIHDVSALVRKEEVIGDTDTVERDITSESDFLFNEVSPDASQDTFKVSENAEDVSTVTDSGLLIEDAVKLCSEESNTVPEESKIISIIPEDFHRDEKDSELNLIVHKRKMGSTRRPLRGKNRKGKTEEESKEMDGDNEGVETEPHSEIQDQDNVIDHNITQEMMDVKYEEEDEKTTKTVRMSVQEPGEDSAANEDREITVEQEQISSSNICQAQSASVQDDANLHLSEDQEKTADFTSDSSECVPHSDVVLSDVQHKEETQSHVSAEYAVVVESCVVEREDGEMHSVSNRSLQKRKMGSTRKTRRGKNMENEREVGEETKGEIENTTIDDGATKTEEIFTHEKVSTTVIESQLHKELFNSSLDNEGHACIQAGKDVNEGSEQKETLFRIKSEHDAFDRGDETSEKSRETPDFKETARHEEVDAEPDMILDVPEHLNDVNDHVNEHAENVSSVTESALLNADALTVGSGGTDTIPEESEITVILENSQVVDKQSESHSEIQTLKKMLQNKESTEEQNDTSSDVNLAAVTVHENEQNVSTVTDSGLHTEDVVTVESGETNTIPEQNETIPENSQEDVHSKSILIVHKRKMGSTRRTHRGNKGQRKRGEHHDENETFDSEINEEKEIFSVEDEHNLDEYTTRTSETEDGAKEQKTEVSESNDAAPVEGFDSVPIQSSCTSDLLSEKSIAVSICNITDSQTPTEVPAKSTEIDGNIERAPVGGDTEPNSETETQKKMLHSTTSEGERTEENIHDVSALVRKEEVIGDTDTVERDITSESDFLFNEVSPDASQDTFKVSENAEDVSTVTDSDLLIEDAVKLCSEESNTVPEESKIISIIPEDSHIDEKDSKLNLIVHKRKMGSTRRPLRGKKGKGKTEEESKEMDGDNEGVEAEPHSDIQNQDNVIDHNITQEMMDVKYEEDDEKTTKTVRMSVQEPGEDSAANEDREITVEQEQISSSNICQAQSASVQDDANLHLSEDQEKTADFTSDSSECVPHSDVVLSDFQHMEETQSHVSAEHVVVVDSCVAEREDGEMHLVSTRSLQKRKMGSTRKTQRGKRMENEREVGEEKEGEIENTTIDDGATKTEEIFTPEKVSTTVIESHLHKELFNSSLDNEGNDCIQRGKDMNESSEQKETLFSVKSEHDAFDRGDETNEESKETLDFKETGGEEEVDAEPVMILDVPEHLTDGNDHENGNKSDGQTESPEQNRVSTEQQNETSADIKLVAFTVYEHAENVSSVTESALLNADALTVGSGETDTIPEESEITVILENSQEVDKQSESHSEIQTLKKMLQNKESTEEQNDTSSDINLAAVTVHENEQNVSTVTDSGLHTEDVVTVESGETNTIPEQNETIPENSQEDVHSKSNLIVHKRKMGSTRRTLRGNKGQRKRGEHHDKNETFDSEINEEKEIFSVEDEHNLDEYTTRTSETEDGAKEQKTEVSESNDAAPVEGFDSVLIQSSCTSDLLSEKSTAVSICNITDSQTPTEVPAKSTEIDGNIERAPVGGDTETNSETETQKKMLHSTTSEGERTEENIHDVSALVRKEEVIGDTDTVENDITSESDFLFNEASLDASQDTFKVSENAEDVSTVTDSGLLIEEAVKLCSEESNTVPEENKIISIIPEDSHRDEKDSKLNLIVHKRKMGSTRRPLRGKNRKGKTEEEFKEMDGDNEGVETEPHSDIQDQDNVIYHNITQEMMDVKYEEEDEKTTKTVRMTVEEPCEDSAANEDREITVEQEQISSSNICQAQSASVQDDANLHLSEDQEKTADFTSDSSKCVPHSDVVLTDVQHKEETQSHVSAEHAVVVDSCVAEREDSEMQSVSTRSLQKRKMGSTRKTRRGKKMENEREVGEETKGEIENTTIDDGATKTEEIFTPEKVSTTVIESHLHKELFNSSLDNEGHDCIQAGKDVNEGSEQKETLFRIKSEHDAFDRGDETSEESKETPDFKETVGHEEVDAEPDMILDVPEHLNDVNDHVNEHAENVSSVTESALLNADALTVGSGETDTIPKEHEIITVIPENSQEDVQSKSHSEIQTLKKMLQNKVSTEEQNDTSSDMNLAAVTVHENEQNVSTVTDSGLHTEDFVTVESGETNTIPEQNETIPENSQEDVHSKSNLIVHKRKMGSTRRTLRGNKGQRKRGEHHDETFDSEINEEKEIFSVEHEHNLDEYPTRTSETEDGAKEQKTEISESNDAAPVEGSDSVLIQSSCTSDLLSEKSIAVSICNITDSQTPTEVPAKSTEIDGNIERAPVGRDTEPNSEIQTQKKMLHSTTSEGERTEENIHDVSGSVRREEVIGDTVTVKSDITSESNFLFNEVSPDASQDTLKVSENAEDVSTVTDSGLLIEEAVKLCSEESNTVPEESKIISIIPKVSHRDEKDSKLNLIVHKRKMGSTRRPLRGKNSKGKTEKESKVMDGDNEGVETEPHSDIQDQDNVIDHNITQEMMDVKYEEEDEKTTKTVRMSVQEPGEDSAANEDREITVEQEQISSSNICQAQSASVQDDANLHLPEDQEKTADFTSDSSECVPHSDVVLSDVQHKEETQSHVSAEHCVVVESCVAEREDGEMHSVSTRSLQKRKMGSTRKTRRGKRMENEGQVGEEKEVETKSTVAYDEATSTEEICIPEEVISTTVTESQLHPIQDSKEEERLLSATSEHDASDRVHETHEKSKETLDLKETGGHKEMDSEPAPILDAAEHVTSANNEDNGSKSDGQTESREQNRIIAEEQYHSSTDTKMEATTSNESAEKVSAVTNSGLLTGDVMTVGSGGTGTIPEQSEIMSIIPENSQEDVHSTLNLIVHKRKMGSTRKVLRGNKGHKKGEHHDENETYNSEINVEKEIFSMEDEHKIDESILRTLETEDGAKEQKTEISESNDADPVEGSDSVLIQSSFTSDLLSEKSTAVSICNITESHLLTDHLAKSTEIDGNIGKVPVETEPNSEFQTQMKMLHSTTGEGETTEENICDVNVIKDEVIGETVTVQSNITIESDFLPNEMTPDENQGAFKVSEDVGKVSTVTLSGLLFEDILIIGSGETNTAIDKSEIISIIPKDSHRDEEQSNLNLSVHKRKMGSTRRPLRGNKGKGKAEAESKEQDGDNEGVETEPHSEIQDQDNVIDHNMAQEIMNIKDVEQEGKTEEVEEILGQEPFEESAANKQWHREITVKQEQISSSNICQAQSASVQDDANLHLSEDQKKTADFTSDSSECVTNSDLFLSDFQHMEETQSHVSAEHAVVVESCVAEREDGEMHLVSTRSLQKRKMGSTRKTWRGKRMENEGEDGEEKGGETKSTVDDDEATTTEETFKEMLTDVLAESVEIDGNIERVPVGGETEPHSEFQDQDNVMDHNITQEMMDGKDEEEDGKTTKTVRMSVQEPGEDSAANEDREITVEQEQISSSNICQAQSASVQDDANPEDQDRLADFTSDKPACVTNSDLLLSDVQHMKENQSLVSAEPAVVVDSCVAEGEDGEMYSVSTRSLQKRKMGSTRKTRRGKRLQNEGEDGDEKKEESENTAIHDWTTRTEEICIPEEVISTTVTESHSHKQLFSSSPDKEGHGTQANVINSNRQIDNSEQITLSAEEQNDLSLNTTLQSLKDENLTAETESDLSLRDVAIVNSGETNEHCELKSVSLEESHKEDMPSKLSPVVQKRKMGSTRKTFRGSKGKEKEEVKFKENDEDSEGLTKEDKSEPATFVSTTFPAATIEAEQEWKSDKDLQFRKNPESNLDGASYSADNTYLEPEDRGNEVSILDLSIVSEEKELENTGNESRSQSHTTCPMTEIMDKLVLPVSPEDAHLTVYDSDRASNDISQLMCEDHLGQHAQGTSEPEETEITSHVILTEELKNTQDDVVYENRKPATQEKRRKMGSTRRNPQALHGAVMTKQDDYMRGTSEISAKADNPEWVVTTNEPMEAVELDIPGDSLQEAFESQTSQTCDSQLIVSNRSQQLIDADVGKLPYSDKHPQSEIVITEKRRKMGSTRKNLRGGKGGVNREERESAETLTLGIHLGQRKDPVLAAQDSGHGMTIAGKSVEEQTLHDNHEHPEGSLLSEIVRALNDTSQSSPNLDHQSIINEPNSGDLVDTPGPTPYPLDVPENPEPEHETDTDKCLSVHLTPSQISQTHIEPSSPGRRRKMGSTRKNPRQQLKVERRDEEEGADKMTENLENNKQGGNDIEKELETVEEPTVYNITEKTLNKEFLDVSSAITSSSQLDDGSNPIAQEKTSPTAKRKFGSRRTNRAKRGLGGLDPPEGSSELDKRDQVQDNPHSDDLTVFKPYSSLTPENQLSHQPVSEYSNMEGRNEETVIGVLKDKDSSVQEGTVAGLLSMDQIMKAEQHDSSGGTRQKTQLVIRSGQVSDTEVIQFNVVMVGNSCVGKTSFIRRFHKGQFSQDFCSTIGVDTFTQTVVLDDRVVKLQMWDTAGQERFHSITKQVFHKADGLLLMYDITSSKSFISVRDWITQVQERAPDDVIMMLLGNKNDCVQREVEIQEGENLAREYNINFIECSAATGDNVSESMKTLSELLVQCKRKKTDELTTLQRKQPQKKSGCC